MSPGNRTQPNSLRLRRRTSSRQRPLRILFVAPYVPSPIRRRALNFLSNLASAGHTVTAIVSDVRQVSGERSFRTPQLTELGVDIRVIHHSFWGGLRSCIRTIDGSTPLRVAFSDSEHIRKAVAQALGNGDFDIVHVENIRAAQYLPDHIEQPVVLDAVDCMSLMWGRMVHEGNLWGRLLARYEYPRLLRYESALGSRFNHILVTTHIDAEAIMDHAPHTRTVVVPHGVDIDHFEVPPRSPLADRVIFSGTMSYHANRVAMLRFAKATWPLVKARRPNAELWIVGAAPGRRLRKVGVDPSVKVTGYVDDIRPYLCRASVAICPISGGAGIQNKILEAMAASVPVVCSGLAASPLLRFGFKDGVHFVQADGATAEAAAVCRILGDAGLAESLASAAKARLRETMAMPVVLAALEAVYEHAQRGRLSEEFDPVGGSRNLPKTLR